MKSRVRLLLPLVLVAVAACGGDDDADDALTSDVPAASTTAAPTTAAPTTGATTAPTTVTPTTAATDTTVATSPATFAVETTNAPTTTPSGPHVVAHAMGETEVPAAPERIVVLDSSFLDAAIALGVTPVGATEGTAGAGLPAYLGEVTDGIEIPGDTTTPNLEAVAALEPDLILGAQVRHEDIYPQLSEIAPTVFSESSGQNWTDQVRLTGDALGRAGTADELIAAFDERAAEVGDAIAASGQTARILRFIPGQTRVYGPSTFSGSVLTAVGFDVSATDTGLEFHPDFGMALVSAEQFELLDADVIFTTDYADEGSALADFEAVWGALPAVAEGRLFTIDDDTWMTGIGVLGANLILDDLETWLG